jgi:hypothetical protein
MFLGCSSLSEIEIPKSVKTVGSWAFGGCPITEIVFPEGLVSIAENIFSGYSDRGTALKSLTIPSTIESIHSNAFEGCYSLTDIYTQTMTIFHLVVGVLQLQVRLM